MTHFNSTGSIVINSSSGGDFNITAGGATGYITINDETNKDTVTVTEKPKRWKRLICLVLGHKIPEKKKESTNPESSTFIVTDHVHQPTSELWINVNGKTYTRKYKACERCGIFHEDTVTYEVPLTEDEKIIKDIIT